MNSAPYQYTIPICIQEQLHTRMTKSNHQATAQTQYQQQKISGSRKKTRKKMKCNHTQSLYELGLKPGPRPEPTRLNSNHRMSLQRKREGVLHYVLDRGMSCQDLKTPSLPQTFMPPSRLKS